MGVRRGHLPGAGWLAAREFSHLFYLRYVAATGRYQVGFEPIIGLNRPSIDTGWAFTWADKTTKLQFNGALGFTFNFENDQRQYETGDEFHFEWAVGWECTQGLVLGLVGYDYRQLTGDSGAEAVLGPFRGSIDAIGPGISYTTLIGTRPLTLSARYYQEFNAENRWEGSITIATATVRFRRRDTVSSEMSAFQRLVRSQHPAPMSQPGTEQEWQRGWVCPTGV